MKRKVFTDHTINAPFEKIWNIISKGTRVDEWLPMITSCQLIDNKRICNTPQGVMNETILKVDHVNHVFKYRIDTQALLPIKNIIGIMKVNGNEYNTQLQWNLEFTINDLSKFNMVNQAIHEIYAAGAKGLEALSEKKQGID